MFLHLSYASSRNIGWNCGLLLQASSMAKLLSWDCLSTISLTCRAVLWGMPCLDNPGKICELLCLGAMVTPALVTATVVFWHMILSLLTPMQGLAAIENVEHIWYLQLILSLWWIEAKSWDISKKYCLSSNSKLNYGSVKNVSYNMLMFDVVC